jgi:hypothetical protein
MRSVPDIRISSLKPLHLTKTWHDHQAVSRVFTWFVKEARLGRTNPFAGVKKPQRGYRRRVLTPAEIVRLLRRARPEARALWFHLVDCRTWAFFRLAKICGLSDDAGNV